jgi:hypothetical protein
MFPCLVEAQIDDIKRRSRFIHNFLTNPPKLSLPNQTKLNLVMFRYKIDFNFKTENPNQF